MNQNSYGILNTIYISNGIDLDFRGRLVWQQGKSRLKKKAEETNHPLIQAFRSPIRFFCVRVSDRLSNQ
jgi:hypothetical protein